MVFVADDLGAWLVGLLADACRKKLTELVLGSEQERALWQAATAAIEATARQWRPGSAPEDDPQSADHLARVIDQVFQQAPTSPESLARYPMLLQGVRAGVAARLAVLEDVHLTGTERSSAAVLDISVPALAETLNAQLLQELLARGARGGPLTPLASQLNHDRTHLQVARLAAEVKASQDKGAQVKRVDVSKGCVPRPERRVGPERSSRARRRSLSPPRQSDLGQSDLAAGRIISISISNNSDLPVYDLAIFWRKPGEPSSAHTQYEILRPPMTG